MHFILVISTTIFSFQLHAPLTHLLPPAQFYVFVFFLEPTRSTSVVYMHMGWVTH